MATGRALTSRQRDGAFEAGRPGRRKELLRVGANARGAGSCKPDVEKAVRGARGAAFASSLGYRLRRVEDRCGIVHGAFF